MMFPSLVGSAVVNFASKVVDKLNLKSDFSKHPASMKDNVLLEDEHKVVEYKGKHFAETA